MAAGLDVPADLRHERADGRLLPRGEGEEVGFVAARDDQRVTGRQRGAIGGSAGGSSVSVSVSDMRILLGGIQPEAEQAEVDFRRLAGRGLRDVVPGGMALRISPLRGGKLLGLYRVSCG